MILRLSFVRIGSPVKGIFRKISGLCLTESLPKLLQRNLIYAEITRGKRLLVLVGQKKALGIAVRNDRPRRRYSALLASLSRLDPEPRRNAEHS